MSNSIANLEEDAAAIRDRHIAALAIFMVALLGVFCNALVAIFTRTLPTLNNSFGRLTASQATGETILCALFVIYYVPMVYFDIDIMKQNSVYAGVALLSSYDVCIFSHLIISLNRMSAVFCPLLYTSHFSNRNTTILIFVIWTISIIIPISLHGRRSCALIYMESVYTMVYNNDEECGRMSWYVDFSQDLIILILIAIIDTITILKFRLTSTQIYKGNSRTVASKRSTEKNFLRQVVVQGVLFAVGLGSYFFFAWFFENKWVIWSLSTLAWCFLHLSDAIITITFNKEFRRLICSWMPYNTCTHRVTV